MATNIVQLASVVGTDGRSPIINQEGKFQTHALHELYLGQEGENKYVPNVGDLVFDVYGITRYPTWRVVSIGVDMVANLMAWTMVPGTIIDEGDYLTGIGGTKQSSTYRCYVDKSVVPYILAVDNRLSAKGSVARKAIIYKGDPQRGTPLQAISLYYDNNGNILGNTIPLELVGLNANTQRTEYIVPVAYTREDLPDNELLTIVFYSQEGHVVGKNEMLVMNTSFIRANNVATKYVTHVSLVSPFSSATDPKLIELPMNVPVAGLMPTGRIHYSDGSYVERGIDGARLKLGGLTSFLATIINQRVPINLIYVLAPDEVAYGANIGAERTMGATYYIRTIPSKGAYYLKMFAYPEWVDEVTGYKLRWWLYNGDRNQRHEVTDLVRFATNVPGFDPKGYGLLQNISAQIDLSLINSTYANYRFAQTLGIVLRQDGTNIGTKWTVMFSPSQSPPYGEDQFVEQEFINVNYYKFGVKGSSTTQEEWLERCYDRTQPLLDPRTEVVAPRPTHMRIRIADGRSFEFPISMWDKTLVTTGGYDHLQNMNIEWISKGPESDMELGMTAIPIRKSTGLPDPE